MTDTAIYEEQPKPLGKLFKWLRIFFIIYIISEILFMIADGLMLSMGSAMYGPGEPLSIGDGVEMLASLLLVLSFIVCIVLFCIFSYRAIKNLTIMEPGEIGTTPGWAVGWYFIPFANLWKPYGVMQDMWTASIYPGEKFSDIPKTLSLWWICWIVSNIASNISMRMGIRAGILQEYASDVPLYKASLKVDIFSSVTGLIAALVILGILKAIAEAQDRRIHTEAFS